MMYSLCTAVLGRSFIHPLFPIVVAVVVLDISSSMRYHVLGTGAIGCHFAVDLRSQHDVTLVLRSEKALQDFLSRQNEITYRRVNQPDETVRISGFDAMVAGDTSYNTHMDAVIVTTKAQHATEAVRSIKPHLSRSSTLVLFQNGMGVADELLEKLWPGPDRQEAPAIVIGVNRHSVMRTEPFDILHNAGWDKPTDGYFVSPSPEIGAEQGDQVQSVMQGMIGLARLNTKIVPWSTLSQFMMKKLVVNCGLNAATGILECSNGEYIASEQGCQLIRQICEECAQVLSPELDATPDELYDIVHGTAVDAAPNKCSTVQDIMAKRLTEIEYINGYIIRKAKERNIPVPTNTFFVLLLHAKEHQIHAK
ncbi:ketopantoate reductase PanE/ApbA C terminal-domain-containing protein [Zychaea mexicana]|uniref:ketopantoate reductase PanE/ApbA C terminal-domain-containing protein n=1 Tax=Zychaea mexicana TaxID=64656 RepID=UPI0022FE0465|nr:ketopantoate reductase PanE/ApbA C terminal-domain-containing protein [Zychaea mexicana]KAI9499631.1 ketopantoate reductase PanE/ApbA C terminal-domain-containing protein [Zychaea mexicana]